MSGYITLPRVRTHFNVLVVPCAVPTSGRQTASVGGERVGHTFSGREYIMPVFGVPYARYSQ